MNQFGPSSADRKGFGDMTVEPDELLKDVVTECLEHTSRIEDLLLSLEETADHPDPEVINNLFRSAHSIKGVVGFCGLTKIKDLAHAFENLLNAFRQQELAPDDASIDLLLKVTDFLKILLNDASGSQDYDIGPYLEQLHQALAGSGAPLAGPPGDKTPAIVDSTGLFSFNISGGELQQKFNKGLSVYILRLDLIRDGHNKGMTPVELVRHVQSVGDIMDTWFDPEKVVIGELEEIEPFLPFGVLLASLLGADMIGAALDIRDEDWEQVTPESTAGLKPPEPEPEGTGFEEIQAGADQQPPAPPPPEPPPDTLPEPGAKAIAPPPDPAGVTAPPAAAAGAKGWQPETSLRVNVSLLDSLMNLAGELVLARNQLTQTVDALRLSSVAQITQRIDLVTSDLQAQIMQTRMQPLDKVFGKFPRLVRDLSRKLQKQVELELEGREVELDKAIVEELTDPLVHLLRNSIDHGIETPGQRTDAGKPATGRIRVRAFHEGGQVFIEIQDDGKGINPQAIKEKAVLQGLLNQVQAQGMTDQQAFDLIFQPGFSTAEQVSDVSGRGVGMDVVRTSLEKLGGVLDLESMIGRGTTVRVKLPLTMAIIPCLIIRVGEERYAIPQVSLVELVRVGYTDIKDRIERVGGAEVLRLRDQLLPLVRLSSILNVTGYFRDPVTNELKKDRRRRIADRRNGGNFDEDEESLDRRANDRRKSMASMKVVVVTAGDLQYGLIVDELDDTEEIVVKPFGLYLKEISAYAGATIMGDGKVAPILDIMGLAEMADLYRKREEARHSAKEISEETTASRAEMEKILVFKHEDQTFAVPISLVSRTIRIESGAVEHAMGKASVQDRGANLRLIMLDKHLPLPPLAAKKHLFIIVFEAGGHEIGLTSSTLEDEKMVVFDVDAHTHKSPGVMGSLIVDGQTIMVLDLFELLDLEEPTWTNRRSSTETETAPKTLLLVEDSDFFRHKIGQYLKDAGFNVHTAVNGADGLAILGKEEVDLILTDIEMPVMNGLEFIKKVRSNPDWSDLPIVALSSLAGDEDVNRGLAAGADKYMIKLDRESLLETLSTIGSLRRP